MLEEIGMEQGRSERTGQARRLTGAGLGLLLAWMMSLLLRGGVLSGPYAGQRSLSFDPFFGAAAAAAVLCLAAFSLPLRFLERRLDKAGTIVTVGLCVALACGATGLLGVVPFSTAAPAIALGAICGGCMAVMLMLWLLVLASFDPRDTVVMVLVDILIALAGFLVIHFTGKVLGSPVATTAVSIAFLAGSFALLVRERFGLTEREGEVLRLLATGRNAASIQDALCVSYNTVKVHKRNIYMKMDIHSQQELLDVMDALVL